MQLGNVTKIILLICLVLILALLSAFYNLDIVNNSNAFINKQKSLQYKKNVALVKCIDGDTAKLKVDGKNITVRLLAIDTPEVNHPKLNEQAYGHVASEYTCNSLKSAKTISISYEKGLYKEDKYHRHLVWLYVDDKLLQEKLISMGYAKVRYLYAKYTYTDKLLALQSDAQNNKAGIWHNYVRPSYEDVDLVVMFKIGEFTKSVEVKKGDIVNMIDNPLKINYQFVGWTLNNKLYDFSKPVVKNISIEAKYK